MLCCSRGVNDGMAPTAFSPLRPCPACVCLTNVQREDFISIQVMKHVDRTCFLSFVFMCCNIVGGCFLLIPCLVEALHESLDWGDFD